MQIHCDNQGALKLIATGVLKAKTKHIDIKFHDARDEQEKGHVKFDYIASEDNVADLLTKALPVPQHQMLTEKLGLHDIMDTAWKEGGVLETSFLGRTSEEERT
jgi:hypothetical protein